MKARIYNKITNKYYKNKTYPTQNDSKINNFKSVFKPQIFHHSQTIINKINSSLVEVIKYRRKQYKNKNIKKKCNRKEIYKN